VVVVGIVGISIFILVRKKMHDKEVQEYREKGTTEKGKKGGREKVSVKKDETKTGKKKV
jgi:hypothetical protein